MLRVANSTPMVDLESRRSEEEEMCLYDVRVEKKLTVSPSAQNVFAAT